MSEEILRDATEKGMGYRITAFEARQIVAALHDAGYAITHMGAVMDAQASVSEGPTPYQHTVRIRVQMTPDVCGAQLVLPEPMAHDDRYRIDYAPRVLADQIMSHYREKLTGVISLALKGLGNA